MHRHRAGVDREVLQIDRCRVWARGQRAAGHRRPNVLYVRLRTAAPPLPSVRGTIEPAIEDASTRPRPSALSRAITGYLGHWRSVRHDAITGRCYRTVSMELPLLGAVVRIRSGVLSLAPVAGDVGMPEEMPSKNWVVSGPVLLSAGTLHTHSLTRSGNGSTSSSSGPSSSFDLVSFISRHVWSH
jgi:hypothetical protein